ncbi:DUF3298 domain-containing protein [candidate division KSB1 bacterium]
MDFSRKFYGVSGFACLIFIVVLYVIFSPVICAKFSVNNEECGPLTIKSIVIAQSSDTRNISITYPQISGIEPVHLEQALNDSIKRKFLQFYADEDSIELIIRYNVILNRPEIVSIKGECYRYKWRMANGINRVMSVVIDRNNGKILHLNDILNKGYEPFLNRYIKNYLDGKLDVSFFEAMRGDQSFCINEDGIEIYFDEYEAAPGSWGTVTVPIPFDSLVPIMKQDSPVQKMVGIK